MKRRDWVETNILLEVERALPSLLRAAANFKGSAFDFGPYRIERLICEYAGHDVFLNRFTDEEGEGGVVGSRRGEPAFAERFLEGYAEFSTVKLGTERRKVTLNDVLLDATRGTIVNVRRGARVGIALYSPTVYSLIVVADPPVYDLPKLTLASFGEILEKFRGFYRG